MANDNDSNAVDSNNELNQQVEALKNLVATMQHQTSEVEKLQKDPVVQQYLTMKELGQEAQIVAKEKEEEVDPLQAILNSLDGVEDEDEGSTQITQEKKDVIKELVKVLPDLVDKKVKTTVDPIQKELEKRKELEEQQKLENLRSSISNEIQDAIKNHTDFADYQEDMTAIDAGIGQSGRLTVEDLYLLAKAKKLGLPNENYGSEKPSIFDGLRARPAFGDPDKKKASGSKGARDVLQEALKKIERT